MQVIIIWIFQFVSNNSWICPSLTVGFSQLMSWTFLLLSNNSPSFPTCKQQLLGFSRFYPMIDSVFLVSKDSWIFPTCKQQQLFFQLEKFSVAFVPKWRSVESNIRLCNIIWAKPNCFTRVRIKNYCPIIVSGAVSIIHEGASRKGKKRAKEETRKSCLSSAF